MKRFTILESVLFVLSGVAIGSIATLIINTIQTGKVDKHGNPVKYNCKFQAILEPEKTDVKKLNSKNN